MVEFIITWMDMWSKTSKVKLLINGQIGREIFYKRGFRPRDPLSPCLFVLVANVLNIMIRHAERGDLIQALPASWSHNLINLQYTNNTIIFGNYDIRQAMALKWILRYFEMWSRLRINFSKTSLIHLGEVNLTDQIIRVIFSYRVDTFPIRYLGFPLRQGRLSKQEWDPLFDQLKRQLEGWKGKYLSFGGRITLINVVL